MESDVQTKKKYKKTIWSLDNTPKFIIVDFNSKKLSPVYNLMVSWNRPVKGIDNNLISIKVSYSDIFFEEKKVSIDRFKLEPNDLVKDVYNKLNKVILLQGLMIENFDNKILRKVNKYNAYILKYIDKKSKKLENRKISNLKNFIKS